MKIAVHLVDDTTAEVGLNNYVYTLKKLSCYVGNPVHIGNTVKRRPD